MIVCTFNPGFIYCTPGIQMMADRGFDPQPYLQRHLSQDYGDLDQHDKALNNEYFSKNMPVLSRYETPMGVIYIRTDPEQMVTTILTVEEY